MDKIMLGGAPELVNGFTNEEIFKFYLFLVEFDKIIQKYSPTLHKAGFNERIPDSKIHCVQQKEIDNHKRDDLSNEIYLVKKRNKPISFIVHLRNAIAHGLIKANDSFIIMEDKYIDKLQATRYDFTTAYGRFDKTLILDVIDYCLSIIKQ